MQLRKLLPSFLIKILVIFSFLPFILPSYRNSGLPTDKFLAEVKAELENFEIRRKPVVNPVPPHLPARMTGSK